MRVLRGPEIEGGPLVYAHIFDIILPNFTKFVRQLAIIVKHLARQLKTQLVFHQIAAHRNFLFAPSNDSHSYLLTDWYSDRSKKGRFS